jgi:hypothetical protein
MDAVYYAVRLAAETLRIVPQHRSATRSDDFSEDVAVPALCLNREVGIATMLRLAGVPKLVDEAKMMAQESK